MYISNANNKENEMQIRKFTINKTQEVYQEVETSKETENFGTHKDLANDKLRVVSHKKAGLSMAKFTTMRDAHKFMAWCEEQFGDMSAKEIAKDHGKMILAHLHSYPSY